ncbi:MAG: hypothetical protein RIT27_28 [Pseudomonadota bacterium]|jgi:Ca2+-binding EF-hand superfamily protein
MRQVTFWKAYNKVENPRTGISILFDYVEEQTMKNLTTLSIAMALHLGITLPAFAHKEFSAERQQIIIDKIMQRFDTNKDNVITLDEVQAIRDALFTKADTNQDGFLSLEEFTAIAEQQRQDHLKAMFDKLDTNQNNSFSLDELLQQPFGNPERKKARFAEMDVNKDGTVSFEEFQQTKSAKDRFMGHFHGMKDKCNDQQSCQQARFDMLDTNKDGKISRVEFVHNLPLFVKFDLNHDGVITREEIAQQLQNKMAHRSKEKIERNSPNNP